MKLGMASTVKHSPGEIDYRLERQRVLVAFRTGDASMMQVCDAQPELVRNAQHCGTPVADRCPICDASKLVHVTYVFGSRLPSGGRCVISTAELQRLAQRKSPYSAYVVEVCVPCHWNHLVRSYWLNPAAG